MIWSVIQNMMNARSTHHPSRSKRLSKKSKLTMLGTQHHDPAISKYYSVYIPTVQPSSDEASLKNKLKAPFAWSHANLEPMKQFLIAEKNAGRFKPAFPMDF